MKAGQIVSKLRLKDGCNVTIRTPRARDIDGFLALINGLVKEDAMILMDKPFKRKEEVLWLRNLLKELKTGKTIYLLAEVNGKIVGGTNVTKHLGKSKHVGGFGISIKDGYRDIGLGTTLAKEVIKQAKKSGLKLLLLEVFDQNPRAIHMYEKIGFREVGRIPKKLYHKGRYHSGIQMAKEISSMK